MGRSLPVIMMLLIFMVGGTTKAVAETFIDDHWGFSVEVPESWIVEKTIDYSKSSGADVIFKPRPKSDFSIRVQALPVLFEGYTYKTLYKDRKGLIRFYEKNKPDITATFYEDIIKGKKAVITTVESSRLQQIKFMIFNKDIVYSIEFSSYAPDLYQHKKEFINRFIEGFSFSGR